MTYSPAVGPAADTERAAQPEVHEVKVELILESHRVSGSLHYSGPPRRLVDMINAIESGYLVVHDGVVGNTYGGDGARSFQIAQVRREGVLIAIPRTDVVLGADAFEAVKKMRVPVTFVVGSYEISGEMHMVGEADPVNTPLLTTRHFVPVTDAVITRAGDGVTFNEGIILVNLASTALYAPRPGRA